jgi:hypothetical protein
METEDSVPWLTESGNGSYGDPDESNSHYHTRINVNE